MNETKPLDKVFHKWIPVALFVLLILNELTKFYDYLYFASLITIVAIPILLLQLVYFQFKPLDKESKNIAMPNSMLRSKFITQLYRLAVLFLPRLYWIIAGFLLIIIYFENATMALAGLVFVYFVLKTVKDKRKRYIFASIIIFGTFMFYLASLNL